VNEVTGSNPGPDRCLPEDRPYLRILVDFCRQSDIVRSHKRSDGGSQLVPKHVAVKGFIKTGVACD
jgi:hypothetical protein